MYIMKKGKTGPKPKVDHNDVIRWRIDTKSSRRETAEHFGFSEWHIAKIWRNSGMSNKALVPPGGTSFKKDWEAIAKYRRKYRASIAETCRIFNVGRTTVGRACKEHGVSLISE
jgi:DNA invertase Pin-like site-specific DNA recombinase